jgi:hypothetical protein
MSQKHWYVAYDVIVGDDEILFTGGEFSEVETREEAIQIVYDKFGHHGAIRIREVEHLENPYKAKKNGRN